MPKALLLLAILLLLASLCSAQEVIYEHYASGTDFWVVIPYSSFNFAKNSQVANYQVSLQIKNSAKKQVGFLEQSIIIPRQDWLQETAIPVRWSLDLPAGNYSAELLIRNKALGEKRNTSKTFQLDNGYTEIGQSWLLAEKDGLTFIPGQMEDLLPKLDKLMFRQSFSIPVDSIHIQANNHTMHINNLSSPIETDLLPFIKETQDKQLRFTFFERNIHYLVEPFLYSPWYSYSLRYSYEDQIAQLRYIATQNEWQVLRSLPKSKYAQAIESFWKANDPSPGTIRNETREKFYQRVLRADEMFTVHKKLKGWSSDRGRIYIKFGEPDEIVSESYPLGRYPNIIWTYYTQNRVFIFADTKGFGLYTLRNKDDEY
jgi:GWxTD domain-containing protein